ncbi:MAG: 50S ribosome-binding GTPase [Methylococcales bacterium]|nr:50S ribosome-binding GTPase [Methylococcales bacterium]
MKNYRFDEIQRRMLANNLLHPLDALLVGATGTGKSTTLNVLFGSTVAKVGDGVDPETQKISSHQLHDFMRFHDSAGLGDGKAADHEHSKNITAELLRTITIDGQHNRFMDIAMVLLDGGSRDMGTAFRLLETVVLQSIEPHRVIVAINQADMAMSGRSWNSQLNKPDPALIDRLEEKTLSVQKRIKESTGLTINRPIYYSAKFNYNIPVFIDHIIKHLPTSRRTITK